MRELVCSTEKQKPVIALLDLDVSRGGMKPSDIKVQLLDASRFYNTWGFTPDQPRGQALHDHLFTHEPIEWNRIGHFQDVVRAIEGLPSLIQP